MGFPGILQKLFSGGGKGGKLRPEIVPDIEPRGVVKMWYGEASAVPEGWAICDGTQGTPCLLYTSHHVSPNAAFSSSQ